MSQPSPDARAVVRALEALTTQVRRALNARQSDFVLSADDADDGATTTADDGPRCVQCGSTAVRYRNYLEQPFCWPCANGQQQAPTDDEDQVMRWARRESLLVLLTRLQRGRALSETEAGTLRQHVETEIREADTARSVAAGNKRHVQSLVPELEQAQAAIERVRALPEDPLGGHAPQGAGQESYVRGWSFAIHAVHEAIDGTEPTTEA